MYHQKCRHGTHRKGTGRCFHNVVVNRLLQCDAVSLALCAYMYTTTGIHFAIHFVIQRGWPKVCANNVVVVLPFQRKERDNQK